MKLSRAEQIEVMLAALKRIRSEAISAMGGEVDHFELFRTVRDYCDNIIKQVEESIG